MPILESTRELIDAYNRSTSKLDWEWESEAVGTVLRNGSRADVEGLLPVFLDNPPAREALVPVFARHGDLTVAERLMAASVTDGRLRNDWPSNVLHAIGYLGYEPAESLLWRHAEGAYYESMDANLGLLHMSCDGLRDKIAAALERHIGSNLFPEFLPALASKTGDPAWLPRLVEWGDGAASTDCNGGLILGIALYGDRARDDFVNLLWNPNWEAYGGGTASDRWAYAGARVLGLSVSELYEDLKRRLAGDDADRSHCIATFVALLSHWGDVYRLGLRMAITPAETSDALVRLLFTRATPDQDCLTDLACRELGYCDPLVQDLSDMEANLRAEAGYEPGTLA